MTSQNTGYGNDLLLPELIPAWLHLQHDFLTVIRNHLLLRLGASGMARERGEEAREAVMNAATSVLTPSKENTGLPLV